MRNTSVSGGNDRSCGRHTFECEEVHDPGVICVLFHGTFAPGSPWTQPGSSLRTRIEEELRPSGNVQFCVFTWRGLFNSALNNRHGDRLAAGRSLQKNVGRLAKAHPGVPIFLIGHSHGGNVIFYALRNLSLRSAVSGIVTMATPFFVCKPRPVSEFGELMGGWLSLVLAAVLYYVALEWFGKLLLNRGLVVSFLVFLVCYALALASCWGLDSVFKIRRRLAARLTRIQARVQLVGVPSLPEIPTYCVYGHRPGMTVDEAKLWLEVGDSLAMLPTLALNWGFRTFRLFCVIVGMVVGFAYGGILGLVIGPVLGLLIAMNIVGMLIIPLLPLWIAMSLLFSWAIRTTPLFFGGEHLLAGLLAEVTITSTPPEFQAGPPNKAYPWEPTAFFVHGIYRNSEIQSSVAHWLAETWRAIRPGEAPLSARRETGP